MGVKRQVIHGKAFEAMREEEARKMATLIEAKGSIGIMNYCRPRLYFHKLTPEEMEMLMEWKVTKYGDDSVQIQAREHLPTFLRRVIPYLGSSKREQANAALELLSFIEDEPTEFEEWSLNEFCHLQELLRRVRGN